MGGENFYLPMEHSMKASSNTTKSMEEAFFITAKENQLMMECGFKKSSMGKVSSTMSIHRNYNNHSTSIISTMLKIIGSNIKVKFI